MGSIQPGRQYRIVETDNFAGDYPDESFVNVPDMTHEHAARVCEAINAACSGERAKRHWMVVHKSHVLAGGFEP